MHPIRFPLLFAFLLLAAGCATPETRIRQNPEKFESLPEDVRSKVERGEVGIGFTEDAVFLALGEPDREYARKTVKGGTKIWSYVVTEFRTERQRVRAPVRINDLNGRSRLVHRDVWVDVRHEREYEETRVEMRDGSVTAIEIISR